MMLKSRLIEPFDLGTLCGVRVGFQAELEARSGFAAAGLRVTLFQNDAVEAYLDSPRGTGNPGDPTYLETYVDVRAPFGPRVEGGWFFEVRDLVTAGFDFRAPIYPGVIVARSTVSASASIVWFDEVTMEVVYDRDRDGICDDVDLAVCGNGVIEEGERCDLGCRLRPGERTDCEICP